METQAHLEDYSDESARLPQNKPENTIEDALQSYLRKGADTTRVHVGETLGRVFNELKWPPYEVWVALEKAQHESNRKN